MLTLWDYLKPIARALIKPPPSPRRASPKRVTRPRPAARRRAPGPGTAQAKYDDIVRQMLHRYNVRVKRWRKSMSGIAYELTYRDGTVTKLIESPRPKSPMSAAIFLHEIGHHAIGLGAFKPRCLEEYHAWKFSLEHMEQLGVAVTQRVVTRRDRSLRYAVAKARRRGIKSIPAELAPYDQ